MFGIPMVGFNARGESSIKTNIGAFITIIIMLIVLLFAAVKFIELNDKKNPVLS